MLKALIDVKVLTKNKALLFTKLLNDGLEYTSSIDEALKFAESEIQSLDETIESIKGLKPECDKLDYALAVSSGALCGVIDIFLVGKPGESPLGDVTDKWFGDRTKDFAKMCLQYFVSAWKGSICAKGI